MPIFIVGSVQDLKLDFIFFTGLENIVLKIELV